MIKRLKKDVGFSFDELYNKAINSEMITEARIPCFRLSSSPFCPLKTLMEWNAFLNSDPIWSFKGDFYCNIGTAVHSALQSWISRANPGYILGHWRCRHCCKNSYNESCINCTQNCNYYVEASIGPHFCPDCGRPMIYEEFQYLLPKVPASGHSDGILLFDPKSVLGISCDLDESHIKIINKLLKQSDSGYTFPAYVLEYKTTTKARVLNMTEPIPHHKAQASMYVGCCNEILADKYGLVNLNVEGTIIKYISRDTPDLRSRDFVIKVKDNSYYKFNKKMIYRIVKSYTNKNPGGFILKQYPCDIDAPYFQYYKDCDYKDMCESYKGNKDLILKVMKQSRKLFLKEIDAFETRFNHKIKRN